MHLLGETIEVREQMDRFTKNLESKIGNNLIPTFNATDPGDIYYVSFGTTVEEDIEDLSHGDNFTTLGILMTDIWKT